MAIVSEWLLEKRLERSRKPIERWDTAYIEFLPSVGEYGYIATMTSGGVEGDWERPGFFHEQFKGFRHAVAVLPEPPATRWHWALVEGLERECDVRFIADKDVEGYMAAEGRRWRALIAHGHPMARCWYETEDRPIARMMGWWHVYRARAFAWAFGTPKGTNLSRPGARI